MKITFSEDKKGDNSLHQARAEQSFSSGDGHGDFCLTAYGQTREQAHARLRQLALLMGRELARVERS